MLKEKLQKLEELKGQELTLLEMEREVEGILLLDTSGNNSIFDGETKQFLEDGEYAYKTLINDEIVEINLYFTILEKDEDLFKTLIKVNNIEEL